MSKHLNKAKIKVLVPNILTALRILFTPIIIILSLCNCYKVAIILIIIASLSDMFDGKLARKWNTVTTTGAKLDAVADKVFAIGLVACLIKKLPLFIPVIILEIIISIINLFSYYKTNITKSLMIGKMKTVSLFIAVVFGFSCIFFNIFKVPTNGLIYVTINLQIITIISYILFIYDNIKNKKIEEAIANDKTKTRTKIYNFEQENKYEIDGDTKVIKNINEIKRSF